jgi:hypothetical protein
MRHRKLPLRVLHRRQRHRDMRRKRPRRAPRKRRALRHSTLFAHPGDLALPPGRDTRRRRRPQRLPRNSSRKPADAAAAIEDGLPNRPRAKT